MGKAPSYSGQLRRVDCLARALNFLAIVMRARRRSLCNFFSDNPGIIFSVSSDCGPVHYSPVHGVIG